VEKSMKYVGVSTGLSFPAAELATEVIASLANRGGGKSNGAAVIVEGLLRAEIPVVVIDYVGIWSSLRLKTDGKTPSEFFIPVLGGPHGDIPLAPSAGAVVAEALAEGQSSAVLDVSSFSKADRCRFAADFAESFFRAKKKHPGPVQLVLEEAQRYIPQRLFHGMERMVLFQR
jgi:DNA helicase HerA-like ATPase